MSAPASQDFPSVAELGCRLPQYEVQALLRQGDDQADYRARQPELDRPVILQVLAEPPAAQAPALQERLRQRARLVHPSLVAVYDFGRLPGGPPYLVVEQVDGSPLSALVDQHPIKPRVAYPLALQLCEALQRVHDQGMVHGTLGPQTVWVTREGRIKLDGMGLAADAAGALSWLQPRQGSLAEDLRALGRTLHTLFAGAAPGPDGRLARDLPPAFAAVLRRCLEPDRPYRRADEVQAALVEALQREQGAAAATTRNRRVIGPGTQAAPPAVLAPPPPRVVPGQVQPIVRQPARSLWQRVDTFVWNAFSTGLHLLISLASLAGLVLLVLFKDRIVFEEAPGAPPAGAAVAPAEEPPIPAAVLGALPPSPVLTVPAPAPKPLRLPAPPPAPPDPLERLRSEYLAAVQAAAAEALDKVRLDDLPHLQRELQLLQNGGEIPAADEANLPASLKALRARYRELRAGLGPPP